MSEYAEGDAKRQIPYISDDGGLTWYLRTGNPATAVAVEQLSYNKVIRLGSADAGVTWTPVLP